MYNFKFELEKGKWYIVLPEWKGTKEELEMVCGADTMLDIMSQGEDFVFATISEEDFDNYTFKLTYSSDSSGGAYYNLVSKFNSFEVWLCHVTKFVFGYLPKELYIK